MSVRVNISGLQVNQKLSLKEDTAVMLWGVGWY